MSVSMDDKQSRKLKKSRLGRQVAIYGGCLAMFSIWFFPFMMHFFATDRFDAPNHWMDMPLTFCGMLSFIGSVFMIVFGIIAYFENKVD